ncbi:MAG TPA: DUF1295 domain-containing protein, partial [Anaerolineales bacterium]
MNFIQLWGTVLLVILGLMTILWLVSLLLRNSSIVDIFWGAGFLIADWAAFTLTPGGAPARRTLIGVLVTLWGLRLALFILWRNWGKPEDFRYQKWRKESGPIWWWKSFFQVFLLQGVLMWLICAPLLAANAGTASAGLTWLDFLGAAAWLIGFFFEAVG